jgi:excisionase family DNA binding protein
MMERPFTIETAAEYLACSQRNVRNLCRAGKLRHFRVGCSEGDKGPIRIPASAMREYVERCGSSCFEESGTPTNESTEEQSEQAWGPRLVRSQNDD